MSRLSLHCFRRLVCEELSATKQDILTHQLQQRPSQVSSPAAAACSQSTILFFPELWLSLRWQGTLPSPHCLPCSWCFTPRSRSCLLRLLILHWLVSFYPVLLFNHLYQFIINNIGFSLFKWLLWILSSDWILMIGAHLVVLQLIRLPPSKLLVRLSKQANKVENWTWPKRIL